VGESPERHYCKICKEGAVDKAALVDHLREEHGIPEVLSFAAGIIITERTGTRMRKGHSLSLNR
jgi:hypothetical protein